MLMVNHYIFARFRYPNKTVLKDINPFTALEYLNYICSKDVSQLESQTVDGVTLHRPSLKLILGYDFYMRKEVTDQMNKGVQFTEALKAVTKSADIRERHFSTPLAVSSATQSLQETAKVKVKSFERQHPYGDYIAKRKHGKGKGKGKRSERGAKGKAKSHLHSVTPDGRQLCFAWNNPREGCKGGCNRVHACRVCLDPGHPAHEHPDVGAE